MGLVVSLAVALASPRLAEGAGRPDRHLGPARRVALVTFPLETLLTGAFYQPTLTVELRVALGARLALTVSPIGVWYAAGGVASSHGGGTGGRLGLQYYFSRSLSGPFMGLQGGDLEAFVGGRRGRSVGGSFTFGYVLTRKDDFDLSLGLGLGYWHRMGILKQGPAGVPEVLSLQLGIGWSR